MKIFSRVSRLLPLLCLGVLCLSIFLPETVAAQSVEDLVGSESLQGLAEIAAVIINIFTFLSLVLLNFGGELLGTDMITGPEAMMAIRPMWVWVRNLVNIVFVGVLVFLAFSNLFSSFRGDGGGSNWTIKDKLPKIIISLVAINFSLLGFRLVIDAINVGTVAILGIADTKLEGTDTDSLNKVITEKSWVPVNSESKKKELKNRAGNKLISQGNVIGFGVGAKCKNSEEYLIDQANEANDTLLVEEGDKLFSCESALAQINDTFCPSWREYEDDRTPEKFNNDADQHNCLFMMSESYFSENETNGMIQSKTDPGRNLFMAFGTTFMHLERLPQLAANLNNLGAVLDNTLFSALMAIAYLVALVVIFIALIARLIVLWLALVFSPLLVAASIMGFGKAGSGDLATKFVTHLIMPLKIAAAFAISFVMLSAMVTFSSTQAEASGQAFWFGPALSQIGQGEYALLWQLATIVIFWMAAFWAIQGNIAEKITSGIKSGVEMLGKTTAEAATIYRPIFAVGTGKEKVSIGSLGQIPMVARDSLNRRKRQEYQTWQEQLGMGEPPSAVTKTALDELEMLPAEPTPKMIYDTLYRHGGNAISDAAVLRLLQGRFEMFKDVSTEQWSKNTEYVLQENAKGDPFLTEYRTKELPASGTASKSETSSKTDDGKEGAKKVDQSAVKISGGKMSVYGTELEITGENIRKNWQNFDENDWAALKENNKEAVENSGISEFSVEGSSTNSTIRLLITDEIKNTEGDENKVKKLNSILGSLAPEQREALSGDAGSALVSRILGTAGVQNTGDYGYKKDKNMFEKAETPPLT
ncbi:MAG: type IV secretion system protein [Candidatus Gracilibacteria bacterium]|nr:type IV secretion system protein [Candidatus Gracilibacteria bacterium]